MENNYLNELKKDAISKGEKYQKLLSQGNELSSNELKEAGELSAQLKELRAKIEVHKDAAEIKNWLGTTNAFNFSPNKADEAQVTTDKNGNIHVALKGLTDQQRNAVCSNSYKDAWNQYIRVGRDRMSMDAYKTLQEGQDISGGFLVPEQIQVDLVQKRPGMSSLSDKVRRLQTGRDSLVVPRNNYTANDTYTSPIRLTQTGEVPSSSTAANVTDPTFGQTKIDVYTYLATETMTKDMLEDSLFDINGFISEKFSETTRLQTENLIINGTGAGQPIGILANPGSTVGNQTQPAVINSGIDAVNGIKPDGLVKLAYALEPQYDGNACFIMNKTNTARGLFQLKDSNNRYLFAQGYQDSGLAGAKPKELLGYEYLYSNLMPNGYTSDGASGNLNTYPIVFGDFSGYYLVERVGLTIQVLDQPLATQNQIQLVGRYRFGGAPVEDWKMKVLKVAA